MLALAASGAFFPPGHENNAFSRRHLMKVVTNGVFFKIALLMFFFRDYFCNYSLFGPVAGALLLLPSILLCSPLIDDVWPAVIEFFHSILMIFTHFTCKRLYSNLIRCMKMIVTCCCISIYFAFPRTLSIRGKQNTKSYSVQRLYSPRIYGKLYLKIPTCI